MCWFRFAASLIAFALFASAAGAQGSAGPSSSRDGRAWMLVLSALTDEQDYENVLASLHLALEEDTWLSVAGGRSRAPSREQDVRAELASLGIEHDFGPIGLGLSAERWGDANNLESRDWRGELFIGGDRYRFSLTREQRAIDIYFSGAGAPVAADLRRVGIDADGIGIRWRFRFAPDWRAYGSWMDYDYPRAVRLVPRADRLDLLSTSAVTLAYGFVDRYQAVGLEHAFGLKLLNVDYSRDRSTIGGEKLKSLAASILWPVAPRMDLEFRLGSSRAAGLGSTLYGGLSLLIYGGG